VELHGSMYNTLIGTLELYQMNQIILEAILALCFVFLGPQAEAPANPPQEIIFSDPGVWV
jgi:hypothetical protein